MTALFSCEMQNVAIKGGGLIQPARLVGVGELKGLINGELRHGSDGASHGEVVKQRNGRRS